MRPGLFAFAAASAFLGAALYINLVEQPARLALDARSMVREWAPSNRRGFVMLASLAAISATLAYVDFAHTGDVRWIIGGTVILASWPGSFEHLVVHDPSKCSTLRRSRTNARLGAARMGTNRNWAGCVVHIRLDPGHGPDLNNSVRDIF